MRIPGNPGALGSAAADLDAVAGALGRDKGELDGKASSLTATGQWTGEGAGAFQGAVARLDPRVDTLVGACGQARAALAAYGQALAAAQADADRLTAAAAAQHFQVDDQGGVHYTGPPVIEDPSQPEHTLAAAQARLEGEAQRILQAAETAAETAKRAIDDARMALVGPFQWSRPWDNPLSTAGYLHGAYTSAASTYSLSGADLAKVEGPRNAILEKLANASSPKKVRHWEKLLARYDRQVSAEYRANLRTTMETAGTVSDRYLPFSKALGYSLGDAAGSAGPLAGAFGSRALRNVPVLGIGLTTIQGGYNIAHGAEPTEEITADATSLVAGAVAADLAVAGMVALGATGFGLPIVAGLVVGGVVAYGVGEAVHWFFHTEVGHDLAQTVDHAVGDAADAVGDAVSKGWHSIFG
jgi:uncharacterized protein YukE